MNNNLLQRGLRLEYITLGWNVVGTAVVMIAAVLAGSVALAGFGIDSLIEIFASVVVVWQLTGVGQDREHRAMRLISIAFFALVIYVLIQSGRTLLLQLHPQTSPLGVIWLAATLIAMLLLAWGKQRTGRQLNNPVLPTEARVTLVDAYLAAAVLVGCYSTACWDGGGQTPSRDSSSFITAFGKGFMRGRSQVKAARENPLKTLTCQLWVFSGRACVFFAPGASN